MTGNGWTTEELSEDTGYTVPAIVWLRGQNNIIPVERRPTRLGGDLWGLDTALALATSKGLRSMGVRLSDTTAIIDFLSDIGKQKLKADFDAGRHWLRVVGDRCEAELLTLADAVKIEFTGMAAKAIRPGAIDVRRVMILLAARAKKRIESKAAKVTTGELRPETIGKREPAKAG
jgi:hypothetical protein